MTLEICTGTNATLLAAAPGAKSIIVLGKWDRVVRCGSQVVLSDQCYLHKATWIQMNDESVSLILHYQNEGGLPTVLEDLHFRSLNVSDPVPLCFWDELPELVACLN